MGFKENDFYRVLPSLAALAVAISSPVAAAAKAPSAGESEKPSTEIVVTATKSGAQRIQDAPLNISAVGSAELTKSGSASMDDVMRQVPGVNVNGAAGNKSIVIRGLAAQAGAAMVGLYLDETVLPPAGAPEVAQVDPRLADIARVEVLRGPQGTLYGAGSVGGTVRYITNQPQLSRTSAAINLRAGARSSKGGGSYQGDLMFNLPIVNDKLAVRIVAWQAQVDGFATNLALKRDHVDKEQSYGARAEVLFQPTPTTKVTGTFHFQSIKLNDASRVFANGNFRSSPVLEPFSDRMWLSSLTVEQKLAFGTLTLTGSHIVRRSEFNLDQSQFLPGDPTNLAVFLPARFKSYDLTKGTIARYATITDDVGELRFSSNFKIPVQVTAGLFYDKTRTTSDIYGFYVDPGTGLPYGSIPAWYETHATISPLNKAAFFNAIWSITDKLSIDGGIRYYDLRQFQQIYVANPFFGLTTGYQPAIAANQSGTVKKAQVTYKPNRDVLVYAVYSQGFRQGGGNTQFPGSVGIPASYAPDFVTNYELGFKTEWADRQIIVNGAIYHMNWNGIQVLQRDNTGAYTYTSNGGKAHFDGFELEARVAPRALRGFSAGLTARYAEQKLAEDNPAVAPFAGLKGQSIPYSNKVGFSGSLDQEFNLAGLAAYAHVDASYTGKGYTAFDPRDPTNREIGDFTIVNARLGIDEKVWHAALYAKNLGNARGFLSWRVEASPGIPDRVNVTPPREVGIEVGYKF